MSEIEALLDAILDDALLHLRGAGAQMALDRWKVPEVCAREIARVPHNAVAVPLADLPALRWAASWHARFVQQVETTGATLVILPTLPGAAAAAGRRSASSEVVPWQNPVATDVALSVDDEWPRWGLTTGRQAFVQCERFKSAIFYRRASLVFDADGRICVRREVEAPIDSVQLLKLLHAAVQLHGGATLQLWSVDFGSDDVVAAERQPAPLGDLPSVGNLGVIVPPGAAPAQRDDDGKILASILDTGDPILLEVENRAPKVTATRKPKQKKDQKALTDDELDEDERHALEDATPELSVEEYLKGLLNELQDLQGESDTESESDTELNELFGEEDVKAEKKLQSRQYQLSKQALGQNMHLACMGEALEGDAEEIFSGPGLVGDPSTEALSSFQIVRGLGLGGSRADDAAPAAPVTPGATAAALVATWQQGVLDGKRALDDRQNFGIPVSTKGGGPGPYLFNVWNCW